MVAAGGSTSAAIVSDKNGSVYTWGQGSEMQLGVEGAASDMNPYVPSPLCLSFFARRTVLSISVGVSHVACIVENEGGDSQVFTWGDGSKGKLGNNSEKSESTPFHVKELRGARAVDIGCGSDFTAMLSVRGDIYTWGSGDSGRTGTGTVDNVFIPVCLSTFGQLNVVEMSVGLDHVAAVTDAGELYTWGYGSNGRLGHGDQGDQLVPLRVEALKDVKIVHASCGGYHTAAVTEDGLLYTFGWNQFGQLGQGASSFGEYESTPKVVEALRDRVVVQVACGDQHTIALVAQ